MDLSRVCNYGRGMGTTTVIMGLNIAEVIL